MPKSNQTASKAENQPAVDPGDLGQAEAQARADVENAQGFQGAKVDPTPNEHYSFNGQAAGLPTPETDDDQAAVAAAHATKVSRGEVAG